MIDLTKPIPKPFTAGGTSNYRKMPFDFSNSLSKEKLVRLKDYNVAEFSLYASEENNAPYFHSFSSASKEIWVRKTVANKLVEVNKKLKDHGVELLVLDGYRPIILQKEVYSFFIEEAKRHLRTNDIEKCKERASIYCSSADSFDEKDPQTWPVHSCGGAIDLTLRRIDTKEVFTMGTSIDSANEDNWTNFYEDKLEAGTLATDEEEFLKMRRLLYYAMIDAGFTNYPCEIWHYDLWDQMWGEIMNAQNNKYKAYYGYMPIPKEYKPVTGSVS